MPARKLLQVTGLVASNSVAFVQAALALYESRRILLVLRTREMAAGLAGVRMEEICETTPSFGWLQFPRKSFGNSHDPAQVCYTSGTEGVPKGILLSHRNLSDVVERLNAAMGLDESVREYIGVPVYHSFGWGRIRACAAVGGACYIPPCGFNLQELADLLRTGQINAVSAVPTLWRTLLARADLFRGVAKKVRWIEIGSQYMARGEKEALRELFSQARIVQHYGLTQASRSTLLDISQTQGAALESVGRPTGQVQVMLSEEGRIRIRGPHVALGRLTAGGLESITDADGWLTTSDCGSLQDGRLSYAGRADDIINCGGVKLSPDKLEQEMRQALRCTEGLAISRYPDPLRGDGILIAVMESFQANAREVEQVARRVLAGNDVCPGDSLKVIRVQSLPRTETGKIKRNVLGKLAGIGDPAQATAPACRFQAANAMNPSPQEKSAALWRTLLEGHDQSDSLAAVEMLLNLEKVLGGGLVNSAFSIDGTAGQGGQAMTSLDLNDIKKFPVPIQPLGDRPPLFCIPGKGGHVFSYRALAEYLGPDQPVYGLQLWGGEDMQTVESMAAEFIGRMRQLRPVGPYLLLGYSFGGKVALEMAQQLRTAGQSVGWLGLIDTHGPGYPRVRSAIDRVARHTCIGLKLPAGQGLSYVYHRFKRMVFGRDIPMPECGAASRSRNLEVENLLALATRASALYRPAPYAGVITVLRSQEQPRWIRRDMGWDRIAPQRVRVRSVPGSHLVLFQEPHVRSLAREINEALGGSSMSNAGQAPKVRSARTPGKMRAFQPQS